MPPVRLKNLIRLLIAAVFSISSLAYASSPTQLAAGARAFERDDSNAQPETIETPQPATPAQPPTAEPASPEEEEDTVLV